MTSPENLKLNEVVKDTTSPEKKSDGGYCIEVVKSPENTGIVEQIQQLESALSHDKSVTVNQVLGTEDALDSMKVVVSGEEMTIAELRQVPDLEKNMKIWQEIEAGYFENIEQLTYITVHIAGLLSKIEKREDGGDAFLKLKGLISISDSVAEQLAKHKGDLNLNGLTSISDTVAEHLSKHQGQLDLDGLTYISDTVAEHLSKHQNLLCLDGLSTISDTVAEHLSKCFGHLFLDGIISMSDTVAEHLSKHQGWLCLIHLKSISDTAAKYLARHKHLDVSRDIKARIDSFKIS